VQTLCLWAGRELQAVAETLSIELLKVQKIFDVRWVFASFVAVKALLRDYPTLFAHFSNCFSDESERNSKEKSKYKGLAQKLQSWFLVCECCMLKDGLRCFKQLSMYLQSREATVINAMDQVEMITVKLLALKQAPGHSLKRCIDSYETDGCYKGVPLDQNSPAPGAGLFGGSSTFEGYLDKQLVFTSSRLSTAVK